MVICVIQRIGIYARCEHVEEGLCSREGDPSDPEAKVALLPSVARMYYLDGLGQSELAPVFSFSTHGIAPASHGTAYCHRTNID